MFKTYYDEDDDEAMELSKRSWVSPSMEFFDYEICNGRAITSLEWSLKVNIFFNFNSIKNYYYQLIQNQMNLT
jgi:hypothetical protein